MLNFNSVLLIKYSNIHIWLRKNHKKTQKKLLGFSNLYENFDYSFTNFRNSLVPLDDSKPIK